jgi:hypothetical protein
MSKMGSHDPFEYIKHNLWPREGLRVKLQIWLPTTKSQELPWFSCVQVACHIPLESSQQRIQLCFRLHLNRRPTHKILGLQSWRSPNFETKWHLSVGPVARHREYYKGKGGGFPQVWVMVSLVNSCLHVVRSCIKSAPTMH